MDAALWAEIRRLCLREGLSQRAVARQLGVDPKTVRKALAKEQYAAAKKPPPRVSRRDPFKEAVRAILSRHPDLSAVRLYAEAKALGYRLPEGEEPAAA